MTLEVEDKEKGKCTQFQSYTRQFISGGINIVSHTVIYFTQLCSSAINLEDWWFMHLLFSCYLFLYFDLNIIHGRQLTWPNRMHQIAERQQRVLYWMPVKETYILLSCHSIICHFYRMSHFYIRKDSLHEILRLGTLNRPVQQKTNNNKMKNPDTMLKK